MNLKEEIRKIVALQEFDSRILGLTVQKDIEMPAQLARIAAKIQEAKQQLHSFEEQFKQTQVKKKDNELELAVKEENLRKAHGQLYQLKTNKDYQAKLAEIGSLKADISIAEEKVLKTMDEVEDAKRQLELKKEEVKRSEGLLLQEQNVLNEAIENLKVQIALIADKRLVAARDVHGTILAQYEALLKTRAGSAIAPVKDNNCGACHMTVTHQKVNEIKMYEGLVFCGSCTRALYIPDDIEL